MAEEIPYYTNKWCREVATKVVVEWTPVRCLSVLLYTSLKKAHAITVWHFLPYTLCSNGLYTPLEGISYCAIPLSVGRTKALRMRCVEATTC